MGSCQVWCLTVYSWELSIYSRTSTNTGVPSYLLSKFDLLPDQVLFSLTLPETAMATTSSATKGKASSKKIKKSGAAPISEHKSRKEKTSSHSSKKAHNGSSTGGSSHHTSHHASHHTTHGHAYHSSSSSSYDHSAYTSYQDSNSLHEEPVQRFVQDSRDVKSWNVQEYDSYQDAARDQHQKELDSIVQKDY